MDHAVSLCLVLADYYRYKGDIPENKVDSKSITWVIQQYAAVRDRVDCQAVQRAEESV